ncbi:hypothetical protein [Reyranella sp. CPCC 100927]|uniref:hypothetical protein n=1 Tax=Reyranella sp. CPCC 100927 TaxID=2599616 RepID=UPI0011B56719|nr:hypothetical protein [Reyranella sp. CPCC 100927]TWS94986.1 hypothetical protein FQU96_40775 [Reyranella sp. CPCC 100927]
MVRHGHPEQRPVSSTELKPYLKTVETLRRRDPSAPLWPLLSSRWEAIAKAAESVANDSTHRPSREAAKLVLGIARDADAAKVVDTALACFMYREAQPNTFASENAFDFQMVRRVRNLAPTNRGQWVNPNTGKTHYAYPFISPRAMAVIAKTIRDNFSLPAFKLTRRLEAEKDAKAQERAAVSEAIDSLDITPKPKRITTLGAREVATREIEAKEISIP